jgi:hypothetical protein
VTEPLLDLTRRTEAALRAKATEFLGSTSLDLLELDALEGVARQLEDRAEQCAYWAFSIQRMGERVTPAREAEMRDACAEWLQMVE